jgi:hypothetical protein
MQYLRIEYRFMKHSAERLLQWVLTVHLILRHHQSIVRVHRCDPTTKIDDNGVGVGASDGDGDAVEDTYNFPKYCTNIVSGNAKPCQQRSKLLQHCDIRCSKNLLRTFIEILCVCICVYV